MLKFLTAASHVWEAFVRLLSRPVIWLSGKLQAIGSFISDKVNKDIMRILLSVFLVAEIVVFAIYAFKVGDIVEILKTLLGCSMFGGFLDFYETLILQSNPGMHLWLTSGFLWILGGVIGKMVEKNGQPPVLQVLHSFVFALFYSAMITPVYEWVSGIYHGAINAIFTSKSAGVVAVNALPLFLLLPLLVFALISGLWLTVEISYDVACLAVYTILVALAFSIILPKFYSEHETMILLFVLVSFIILYIILKHKASKKDLDEYHSVSLLKIYFNERTIKGSVILSILSFFISLWSLMVFLELVASVLFPEYVADLVRGLPVM